ncbi:MAG: SDR family oxidoreductase [Nitrospiraceae bacterium]|nr:SDR family oxidoreductase [Nitrospiraceae bacterium]
MKELEGKVAIVTGAGSPRGMGRATCEALADMGARIAASDLGNPEPDPVQQALGYAYGAGQGLDETVESAKALGVDAIGIRADVTSPEEVESLVAQTVDALGRLDIVVNVAGGTWGSNTVQDYDPAHWLNTIKVNLFGTFLTTKFALPRFEAGGGCIVNIASIAAERSLEMASAYGAAKAGIVQFTKDVAVEYGPQGVRANALLPGDIRTDLYAMECKGNAMLRGITEDEFIAECATLTPLRRIGLPKDVADVVAYLCTDRAAYLTGLAIPVTGGRELPLR